MTIEINLPGDTRIDHLNQPDARRLQVPAPGSPPDPDLGPFQLLPGTWANIDPGQPGGGPAAGHGWNMIALPFATADGSPPFRLLLNQFNETLTFNLVDKAVPNRGISANPLQERDQFDVTLDYVQSVGQISATDNPRSTFADPQSKPIHHEPGLFLNMVNRTPAGNNIARLGSIPHGDSVLAIGKSSTIAGPPAIPAVDGLPIGVDPDPHGPGAHYLAPYLAFDANPFKGVLAGVAGFPGFNPLHPHLLLAGALVGQNITRTTVLDLSTETFTAGIHNIPFVTHQANPTSMTSTFWIEEIDNGDNTTTLQLQYLQVVLLDFFPRPDNQPGLIRWPHVSINTMRKIA